MFIEKETKNNYYIRDEIAPNDIVMRPEKSNVAETLPPGTFARIMRGSGYNVYAVAFNDSNPWKPLWAKPLDEDMEKQTRELHYLNDTDTCIENQDKLYSECVQKDGYYTDKGASHIQSFFNELAQYKALAKDVKTLSVPQVHEVTLLSHEEAKRVPLADRSTKIDGRNTAQWTREAYYKNHDEVHIIEDEGFIYGTMPAKASLAVRPLHKFRLEPNTLLEGQEYIREEDGMKYKYIGKDKDGWDMGYCMEAECREFNKTDKNEPNRWEDSDIREYLNGEYAQNHNIQFYEHELNEEDIGDGL